MKQRSGWHPLPNANLNFQLSNLGSPIPDCLGARLFSFPSYSKPVTVVLPDCYGLETGAKKAVEFSLAAESPKPQK